MPTRSRNLVDSYNTELIADRVWCWRAQVQLATVEWVGWFNQNRLHEGGSSDARCGTISMICEPWCPAPPRPSSSFQSRK